MKTKKRLSGAELLEAWKNKEKEIRLENEIKRREKLKQTPHECKNCVHSWYRYVEPVGCFKEPSEFCGCRLKVKLVDPHGSCNFFDVDP